MSLLLPSSAAADGGGELPTETQGEREVTDIDRSRKVGLLEEAGGHLVRPEGWVESKPSKGAAAVLHAAGVPVAQIELRVSEGIPEDRQGRYFDAYHSKLQSAGFERVRGPVDQKYGDHQGRETEYEGTARGDPYRLIVWTLYLDRRAWVATAFFSKKSRGRLYPDFQTALDSVVFPSQPPSTSSSESESAEGEETGESSDDES